jgi:pyridoxine kinase
MSTTTPHILSIQSHVATGYVGNRAAVFPLQRLGCEVTFINTVQFSNHTGYGKWTGDIFTAEHIQNVINGLWDHGAIKNIDAVLSGYQGSSALGKIIVETVERLKKEYPEVIYCCDPVMGDTDRGIYVKPDAAEFVKHHAVYAADIITPNQYELGYLLDREINSLDDVKSACQVLHDKGIKIILVTSLTREGGDPNSIEILLSINNEYWVTKTPRLSFPKALTGSGDATTAIFLAEYLKTKNAVVALEKVTAAIYAIFKKTHEEKSYELAIIEAQEDFVNPSEKFFARRV